jgi:hypothetical protein
MMACSFEIIAPLLSGVLMMHEHFTFSQVRPELPYIHSTQNTRIPQAFF